MGAIVFAAAVAGSFLLLLYALQESLIYHPLPSRIAVRGELPPDVEPLRYSIPGPSGEPLAQESYLALPASGTEGAGARVAVLFHGNASSALDWLEEADYLRERGFHLLMVEYPGYGRCEGRPSPDSIGRASEEAFKALARRLGAAEQALEQRTVAAGHSLGSAAALMFASGRSLDRVILLAPFTSSLDVARRRVGWPLCLLLRHRYDNERTLRRIVEQSPATGIVIIHGERDDIIPPEMSRRLARISPAITLRMLPDADHVTVVPAARELLLRVLAETQ